MLALLIVTSHVPCMLSLASYSCKHQPLASKTLVRMLWCFGNNGRVLNCYSTKALGVLLFERVLVVRGHGSEFLRLVHVLHYTYATDLEIGRMGPADDNLRCKQCTDKAPTPDMRTSVSALSCKKYNQCSHMQTTCIKTEVAATT